MDLPQWEPRNSETVKAQRPDLQLSIHLVDINIPADCDIAVVQAVLADRARKSAPQAQLAIINNFLLIKLRWIMQTDGSQKLVHQLNSYQLLKLETDQLQM